jgi:glucose-6-phosphate 1-dehydrogenase
VQFRTVPHLPFSGTVDAEPNVLRFGLEPESVSLHLNGTTARGDVLTPLTLAATPEPAELPPYGRLLLDVLNSNSALSIRADEAEESWRVVTPVLDAWAKDLVPLEEYPAGSNGPALL